uniref:Uncharacterized protein n=1 Tax=Manihot esculenta TaxID=3983 RepID=A0A2C9V358_MANES
MCPNIALVSSYCSTLQMHSCHFHSVFRSNLSYFKKIFTPQQPAFQSFSIKLWKF